MAFAKLFTATNRATGQKETVEMRGHGSFVIPSVQMNARVMNGHPPPPIASFMHQALGCASFLTRLVKDLTKNASLALGFKKIPKNASPSFHCQKVTNLRNFHTDVRGELEN